MPNPRLDEIMNAPNLLDVIAQPTEEKNPNYSSTIDLESNFSEDFDFDAIHQEQRETEQEQQAAAPVVPLQPYDAKKHATSLVNGLVVAETLVLSPIATVKARKSIGGNKVIKAMRAAYQKEFSGEELDDQEKRLVEKYKDYEAKMKMLSDDILPSDSIKKQLIDAAIPYMEEVRWEIGPGAGFWTMYVGSFASKVAKILMT